MKYSVLFLAIAFLLMTVIISPVIAANDSADDSGTAQPIVKPQLSLPIAVLSAFAGVFLSFIIPVLAKYGVKIKTLRENNQAVNHIKEFSDIATPYLITAVQSLLIAVVVVAVVLSQGTLLTEWYVAFIAGYTFDATIQKVKAG